MVGIGVMVVGMEERLVEELVAEMVGGEGGE